MMNSSRIEGWRIINHIYDETTSQRVTLPDPTPARATPATPAPKEINSGTP